MPIWFLLGFIGALCGEQSDEGSGKAPSTSGVGGTIFSFLSLIFIFCFFSSDALVETNLGMVLFFISDAPLMHR